MFSQNSSIYGVIMESGSWNPINVEISPNCPRCGSTNTKFCYYNNYSLTQPRYFCKGCKRYWTKGGSIRNIPVGGGCRKSRKTKYGHRSSRSLPEGTSSGHGHRFISRLSESSGSVTGSGDSGGVSGDGCNIDIASVYSNFLKPMPEPNPKPIADLPQFAYDAVSPLFDYFSSVHEDYVLNLDEENGLSFCGFDSIDQDQQDLNLRFMGMVNENNYVLPPSPDLDGILSDSGLVWPSSDITQSGQDPIPVSDQNESLFGATSTYGIFSGLGK